jgi:hypothetical protein
MRRLLAAESWSVAASALILSSTMPPRCQRRLLPPLTACPVAGCRVALVVSRQAGHVRSAIDSGAGRRQRGMATQRYDAKARHGLPAAPDQHVAARWRRFDAAKVLQSRHLQRAGARQFLQVNPRSEET